MQKITFTRIFSSCFLREMAPTIMRVGCQEQFNYLILLVRVISFAQGVEIKVLSLDINQGKKVKLAVWGFTYNLEYYIFIKSSYFLNWLYIQLILAVFWVILHLLLSKKECFPYAMVLRETNEHFGILFKRKIYVLK